MCIQLLSYIDNSGAVSHNIRGNGVGLRLELGPTLLVCEKDSVSDLIVLNVCCFFCLFWLSLFFAHFFTSLRSALSIVEIEGVSMASTEPS